MNNPIASKSKYNLMLWLNAALIVTVWGGAFSMIDVVVREISPLWVVAIRLILGTLMVWIYLLIRGKKPPNLSNERWRYYAMLSFIGMVIPFLLVAKAQIKIHSGLAGVLVGAMPIFTIILAHFFTSEKLTWIKFLGFLIGFSGIILLFLPIETFKNLSEGLSLVSTWKEQLWVLLAAFFYAITTVIAKHTPKTDAEVGALMMLICGSLTITALAMLTGLPPMPSGLAWLNFIGLALGATAYGTIIYLWIINRAGPTFMARMNYFIPLTSVLLGALFLKEKITLQILIAFALIIGGIIISRIQPSPS